MSGQHGLYKPISFPAEYAAHFRPLYGVSLLQGETGQSWARDANRTFGCMHSVKDEMNRHVQASLVRAPGLLIVISFEKNVEISVQCRLSGWISILFYSACCL